MTRRQTLDLAAVPSYAELPMLDDAEHHAWDVFGDGDELGCLNFLSADRVAAAAGLIQTGERISVNLPVGVPRSQFWAGRGAYEHHIEVKRTGRDDHLDRFFLQGSTQWDGFGHVRFRGHGYYGGRQEADLDEGTLGVDRWAVNGIFGRGVLADVAAHLASCGEPIDPQARVAIDRSLIEATLDAQGVALEPGTVLLVRTGWLPWYLGRTDDELAGLRASFEADRTKSSWPGIDPGIATVAWLWDNQVAAIACDNATLEAIPYVPENGWAHHRLLALLGMPLGELWDLEALAGRCAALGRYEFFLASAPLAVRRGVGSPANAYGIF